MCVRHRFKIVCDTRTPHYQPKNNGRCPCFCNVFILCINIFIYNVALISRKRPRVGNM